MGRRLRAASIGLVLALALAGCGHDWSAADTSDVADEVDAVDGDVSPDDGTGETRPEVDDGDVPAEDATEATDEAAIDVPVCDPSDDHCTDGWLRRCRSDGTGWDETYCDFGCALDELRCLRLAPSNVTDDALLDTGTTALEVPLASEAVFDTGTGAITVYRTTGTEVLLLRAPGTGTIDGIPFVIEDRGDTGPALGIWVFSRVAVATGALIYGTGPNAMVLLVGGDALIDGVIDVGGPPERLGGGLGPGAAAGGLPMAVGQGTGGGRPGQAGSSLQDSGGGGAGCGGQGGRGGNTPTVPGGAGGSSWGSPTLEPLGGGSGGGGGGDETGRGGPGGAGGGAFQLSAAGRIAVATGGGVTAGGRGGRGGLGAGAGGGGGSGGAVLLEAREISILGGVAANGGGGGAGSADTATHGADGQPGELRATPGAAGGPRAGLGEAGGSGSDTTTVNGTDGVAAMPPEANDTGGGGGGAGRIRLNAPAIVLGGFLSPAESTALTTRGTCATR